MTVVELMGFIRNIEDTQIILTKNGKNLIWECKHLKKDEKEKEVEKYLDYEVMDFGFEKNCESYWNLKPTNILSIEVK